MVDNPSQPASENRLSETIYSDSELVIALVGAVGTELDLVETELKERLQTFGYTTELIHISEKVIPTICSVDISTTDQYARISSLMDAGNKARESSKDNAILAYGAVSAIGSIRVCENEELLAKPKRAYIIKSLKHPDEIGALRKIYSRGFYLIGVYSDERRRVKYLKDSKRIDSVKATELIERDADENLPHGQRTRDSFHLSDFFIYLTDSHDKMRHSIWRILDLLFGYPYSTPTFDEYAMFLAFAASLRSADLSRQVGAVIARDNEILATGANDCPRYGGGLYWPESSGSGEIIDKENGRDYMRGYDSNTLEKGKIIEDIASQVSEDQREDIKASLWNSKLGDITEYGRVVHAEMDALLTCSRNTMSARGGTLYCTTFPCHNCAKHIIASGIKRVVYVEPYPKSKAADFHSDSISLGFTEKNDRVQFEPFVGVGPRMFFDLFSMHLSSGSRLVRKKKDGSIVEWEPENAKLRIPLIPSSYLDFETAYASKFSKYRKEIEHG